MYSTSHTVVHISDAQAAVESYATCQQRGKSDRSISWACSRCSFTSRSDDTSCSRLHSELSDVLDVNAVDASSVLDVTALRLIDAEDVKSAAARCTDELRVAEPAKILYSLNKEHSIATKCECECVQKVSNMKACNGRMYFFDGVVGEQDVAAHVGQSCCVQSNEICSRRFVIADADENDTVARLRPAHGQPCID